MHSIRLKDDERGDSLRPNAEALTLQRVSNFGINSVFEGRNSSAFTDWTRVVTNPGLLCKCKLS